MLYTRPIDIDALAAKFADRPTVGAWLTLLQRRTAEPQEYEHNINCNFDGCDDHTWHTYPKFVNCILGRGGTEDEARHIWLDKLKRDKCPLSNTVPSSQLGPMPSGEDQTSFIEKWQRSASNFDDPNCELDDGKSNTSAYLGAIETNRWDGRESMYDWVLPGYGLPYESCGLYRTECCDRSADPNHAGNDVVRRVLHRCGRMSCPIMTCLRAALGKEADRGLCRLVAGIVKNRSVLSSAFRSGIFNSGMVGFSPADVERSKDPVYFMKVVQRIADRLKAAGLRDFLMVIHPFAFDSDFKPVWRPHVHYLGSGYIPNRFMEGDDDQRLLDLHVYGKVFMKTADKTVAELRAEARPLPRSERSIWKGFDAFSDAGRARRHLFYLLTHAGIRKSKVRLRGRSHASTHIIRYYGGLSNSSFDTDVVLSNSHDVYSRLQELNKAGFSDRYMRVQNPYTCSRPAEVDSIARVVLAGRCMLPVPSKSVKLGSLQALMPASVRHPRPEPVPVHAGLRSSYSPGSMCRSAHVWWPVAVPEAVARREKPADRRDERSVWWPKAGFRGMSLPKKTSALPARCLRRRPAVLGLVGRGVKCRRPIMLAKSSKILFECVEVAMQYVPIPPEMDDLDVTDIVLKDKPVLRFYKAQFEDALKSREPFIEPAKQSRLTGTKPAFPKSTQAQFKRKRDDKYVIVLRYRYRACDDWDRVYRDKFAHRVIFYDPCVDRLCLYCHHRFKGCVPVSGMLSSDFDIAKSGPQLVEPGSFTVTSVLDDLVVGVPYYPAGSRVVAYARGLKVLPSNIECLTSASRESLKREHSISVLRWVCNVVRSGAEDVNRREVYGAAVRVVGKYGLPSLNNDESRNDFVGSVELEYKNHELPHVSLESMLSGGYKTIDSFS